MGKKMYTRESEIDHESVALAEASSVQLPPSNDDDPLMTMSEVARYVGKSPQTIARWVQDGLLTAVRVGPLFKIRRSALAKFMGGSALQGKGA